MAIWFRADMPLETLNDLSANTLVEVLGIRFTDRGDDYLTATMPVDRRTVQPAGLLHGGASVALAESLGSFASLMCVDAARFHCVGVEVNANHIRAVREGTITGVARPIHLGRSTHVWEIRIHDSEERLVCVSRLTMAVLARPD